MKLTRRTLKLQLKSMKIDIKTVELARQLFQYMQESGGIGLSANQVGLRDRCFVMCIDKQSWFCANPEIINVSNNWVEFDEGCLSFPGETCTITRPDQIEVKFQDTHSQWQQQTLTGLASRCFQHELDHLNGITMWDRHKEQNAKQSRN